MSNTLFLDIETTGFSTDWDFILEIAAEIVSDVGHVIGQFHELFLWKLLNLLVLPMRR